MEREFYKEEFEDFLKHQADQFKLTPSKKVWHGIYNDLHPGRRWPSAAMSLVFIFTLVIISHLNTNTDHKKLTSALTGGVNNIASHSNSVTKGYHKEQGNIEQNNSTEDNADKISGKENIKQNLQDNNILPGTDKSSAADATSNDIKAGDADVETRVDISNKIISPVSNLNNSINTSDNKNVTENSTEINETEIKNNIPDKLINLSAYQNAKTKITDKGVIKNIKVKRNNLRLTYYLMPSISYRSFSSRQIDNAVLQKPMLSLEAGTHLSYRLFNQLQFTTGLQLDYLRYQLRASNTHPILASVNLNSATGQTYTYTTLSNYGNGSGTQDTKLKNYSVQASLPIGLLYTFAGNNNIKFNIEGTFQPSYIIAGNSYMLSTDQKNYLTDNDLLRKWNMSTNFGTFVSFKSNSLNWEIGPEIHYQLLSTYTNSYPFKEHLFNYGLHIGVTKILK